MYSMQNVEYQENIAEEAEIKIRLKNMNSYALALELCNEVIKKASIDNIPSEEDTNIFSLKVYKNGIVALSELLAQAIDAAMTYLKSSIDSRAKDISDEVLKTHDIHIHLPAGATPKDGPSAGITIYTALYSLLSNKKIRQDIAMTGEITLKGRVLEIGGLKEKLTAAVREGIKEVIIPKENEHDLAEIPEEIKKALIIHSISHASEIQRIVFDIKISNKKY